LGQIRKKNPERRTILHKERGERTGTNKRGGTEGKPSGYRKIKRCPNDATTEKKKTGSTARGDFGTVLGKRGLKKRK